MVVENAELAGLFIGSPEGAWDEASELSKRLHITYKDRPFHTVLSCAPKMYDELWVGGKCMYKLEPVVADGGELIIYAPHIHEISLTHGELIRADRLPLPRLLPEAVGPVQGRPVGDDRALHARPRHRHLRGRRGEMPRPVTLATGIPEGNLPRR